MTKIVGTSVTPGTYVTSIFGNSWPMRFTAIVTHVLSWVQLFAMPWTAAHQAPLSTGFSRQEYWSRLPFSLPWGISEPRIESVSPASAGRFFTTKPPGKHVFAVTFSFSLPYCPGSLCLTIFYIWLCWSLPSKNDF